MQPENLRAAILWTGGKDCNLALYEAKSLGYNVVLLVTFGFENLRFKAHPLEVMRQQAKAVGIPHVVCPVTEPYAESYEKAILWLKKEHRIETIVTGDIAEIHGNANWITERCKPAGVDVFLPLWHLDRETILNRLVFLDFKVVFSCVKEPWFVPHWLGREIDHQVISELKELHASNGLDICGEQGEYHTLVLDGPVYEMRIELGSFERHEEDSLMYLSTPKISCVKKVPGKNAEIH